MNALKRDWRWADTYLPQIRAIIGPHLLETAPLDVDRNEASDLVMLRARNLSIACRVRRSVGKPEFLNQFTLRSKRPSGAETEFDKVVNGWGDYMFYAFEASGAPRSLGRWYLIDLHAFRATLIRNAAVLRSGSQDNADGTSFRWYDITSFPTHPPLLIAQGGAAGLTPKRKEAASWRN